MEPIRFWARTEPIDKACVRFWSDAREEVNPCVLAFDLEALAGLDVIGTPDFSWENQLTFGGDDRLHGSKMRVLLPWVKWRGAD